MQFSLTKYTKGWVDLLGVVFGESWELLKLSESSLVKALKLKFVDDHTRCHCDRSQHDPSSPHA